MAIRREEASRGACQCFTTTTLHSLLFSCFTVCPFLQVGTQTGNDAGRNRPGLITVLLEPAGNPPAQPVLGAPSQSTVISIIQQLILHKSILPDQLCPY
ncbi:hypothetical protein PFLUV_G00090080 [Perca fluviatilis]|uniref:Uncharacterized protein n=1 Tax=Perca fluviatilis TaxID=8168 RepID=A0A6A5F520_PERFL|nr:hypothetical protein PFLUV_G00090080 [Perca fluviatilis]